MAEEPVGILDDLDSAEEEDTDLLKLKPPRPPRPKKIKETLKEPLYEEDIIEGFSFCSFKTYEDLDVRADAFRNSSEVTPNRAGMWEGHLAFLLINFFLLFSRPLPF